MVNSNYACGRMHAFLARHVRQVSEPNSADLEEMFQHDTHLCVLAVAAAPDRTDVVVEWECARARWAPGAELVAPLRAHDLVGSARMAPGTDGG